MRVVSDANCAVVSGANFAVVNDTATHPTPPHPFFEFAILGLEV